MRYRAKRSKTFEIKRRLENTNINQFREKFRYLSRIIFLWDFWIKKKKKNQFGQKLQFSNENYKFPNFLLLVFPNIFKSSYWEFLTFEFTIVQTRFNFLPLKLVTKVFLTAKAMKKIIYKLTKKTPHQCKTNTFIAPLRT